MCIRDRYIPGMFQSANRPTLSLFSLHFEPIIDQNCSFSYTSYGNIYIAQKTFLHRSFVKLETKFGMVVLHGSAK